jgi:hypothetical protein
MPQNGPKNEGEPSITLVVVVEDLPPPHAFQSNVEIYHELASNYQKLVTILLELW